MNQHCSMFHVNHFSSPRSMYSISLDFKSFPIFTYAVHITAAVHMSLDLLIFFHYNDLFTAVGILSKGLMIHPFACDSIMWCVQIVSDHEVLNYVTISLFFLLILSVFCLLFLVLLLLFIFLVHFSISLGDYLSGCCQ